ncbi:MAG: flagellar basal body rod protein FlgC [bacterium]
MGLNEAMDINVSGIEAQRIAMELIASNIANINTTRTVYGGPYRRRVAVLSDRGLTFDGELDLAESRLNRKGGGVEVVDIVEDTAPFPKVYQPGHPDADREGFLALPNVNLATEMVGLTYTQRLYEANITAFNASKKMMQDTLQLQ